MPARLFHGVLLFHTPLGNSSGHLFQFRLKHDTQTQILPKEVIAECPKNYFEGHLKAGRCFVLFDGLDEVANSEAHRKAADKITNFVAAYPKNRFVVTCRVAGWLNLLPDFRVLQADDLSREEVHRFIRGWHTAIINLQERI